MDESTETLVKGDERGIEAGVDGAQRTGWEWDWRSGKRCRKELCDALKAKNKKWHLQHLTWKDESVAMEVLHVIISIMVYWASEDRVLVTEQICFNQEIRGKERKKLLTSPSPCIPDNS
ncbi:hypothetical protein KIL84_016060 [Mauremys mutica]|uniref:Uncharacterized protein n=1 Tax=Mauremys mutica TaxID=74926 RepID=A0A9D4AQ90_9SAUR|nr:hypothetical protein KIL84_016060 [Mauremys mutica]